MNNPSANRRGPTGRQRAIVHQLRTRIVAGGLAPGARLPTRIELQREFASAPVTVQKALDQLRADGFVRTAGRHGTFVSDAPPCLARFAVVFPEWAVTRAAHCIGQALLTAVAQVTPTPTRALCLYHDVTGHADDPEYQRLLADVRGRRLAGIVWAQSPHVLIDTPLWTAIEAAELPMVAIMSAVTRPGLATVAAGDPRYPLLALDWLRQRGVRRLALLFTASSDQPQPTPERAELLALVARRGMTVLPEWVQTMHPALAGHARPLAKLLLSGPPATRPDGLFILDDVLVAAATQGAVDAGRTAADLAIVAHANFPTIPPAALPVARLGYDTQVLLDCCLQTLATRQAGGTVPALQRVPAQLVDAPNLVP